MRNKAMQIWPSVTARVAQQSRMGAALPDAGPPRRDDALMTRRLCGLLLAMLASTALRAATPAELEYTVQQILSREGALFVSYSIGDSGKVILLFGVNEPDWRIEKAVQALQSHPDIRDLSWVKTDNEFCPIR
jgi:hypothetical protein